MQNYKAILPAVLVILLTVTLTSYYVARRFAAGNLQKSINNSTALPHDVITVYGDSEIAVRGTPLSFKIVNLDQNLIEYQFFKGTDEIDPSKHIYSIQTQASDNATYAIVKIKTVFDDCENDVGLDFCAKSTYNRFKTIDACESAIGVVSVSYCQDLVLLGSSGTSIDPNVCNRISNQQIKVLCLRR